MSTWQEKAREKAEWAIHGYWCQEAVCGVCGDQFEGSAERALADAIIAALAPVVEAERADVCRCLTDRPEAALDLAGCYCDCAEVGREDCQHDALSRVIKAAKAEALREAAGGFVERLGPIGHPWASDLRAQAYAIEAGDPR